MKNKAFVLYLASQRPIEAVEHVVSCLASGGQENVAWELMEEVNGPNWKCEPERLRQYIFETIKKAIEQVEESA